MSIFQINHKQFNHRPNTFSGPLSFKFVSDRSFKFIRFQIGPLSFEFVSDRSFNVKAKLKDLSETNSKLKGPI